MDAHTPVAAVNPVRASQTLGWLEWRGAGRVLVVEDDAAVRVLVARALPRLGFTVSTARDGDEALSLMRAVPHEHVLVLVDLKLPGMDTADLVKEIRRLRPEVPVVMMTGYMREKVTERLGDIPISGYIQKPFTLERLAGEIRSVLGS